MTRSWCRGLLAAAVALVALVTSADPAAAHASLVSVDPPDGARLDEAPSHVTLTFSEPVSAALGGVRVVGADGARADEGAARVRGTAVEVDLAANLPDGTYVVTYRVVSEDGHPVRGATVFGVGEAALDVDAVGRVADDDDRTWEVVGGVARGIAYAGVLTAAGGAMFLLVALREAPERRRFRRVVQVAAVVGGAASLVALPVQAALGTGQGALALFDDGVLSQVAQDGLGHSLLLAMTGLVLVVVGLDRSSPAAVVGALVASGSFAATGHNRAGDHALLATLADVAHLIAAAVWGGGLLLLLLTVRSRRRADVDPNAASDTPAVVARFSTMATASIVAIGAAGLALGWTQVRTLDGLTGTTYGRVLLVKLAIVGMIAGFGAYNHFRLVPAMARTSGRAALARLSVTVRTEVFGVVLVSALTALLVVLTPARASEEGGVVETFIELEGVGSVQVVVDPARAGFNQLHLYTYDLDGRPNEIAESVTLELSLPAADIGPLDREPQRAGPAHLQLDGDDLAVAGTWEILIRARVDRFTQVTGSTTVRIAG